MASSIPKEMKALQIHKQGGYEVLEIHTIPVPEPKEGEVLLKTEVSFSVWASWGDRMEDGLAQTRRRKLIQ